MTAEPNSAPWNKTAMYLGAALLVGCGAMLAFTIHDNSRRSVLETVTEPRAVGDERFFPNTTRLEKNQQLATFGNRVLLAAETERVEKRDSRMEKVALDDTVSFYIYHSTDPAERDFYFLKTARDKYIQCVAK